MAGYRSESHLKNLGTLGRAVRMFPQAGRILNKPHDGSKWAIVDPKKLQKMK